MTRAFQFCPDFQKLAEDMKARLHDVSALYVLAAMKQPFLRPVFLEYLDCEDPEWAQAAAVGLKGLALTADVPALRRFAKRWESGSVPELETPRRR